MAMKSSPTAVNKTSSLYLHRINFMRISQLEANMFLCLRTGSEQHVTTLPTLDHTKHLQFANTRRGFEDSIAFTVRDA